MLSEEFREITEEELRDRLLLERKVERAFYEAGKALRELRSRGLFRSSHNSFEQYVRERFGFHERHCYRLINACGVVDNLIQLCPSGTPLPTTERQVRSLTNLEPQQQAKAWNLASRQTANKVPSTRIVENVINLIKSENNNSKIGDSLKLAHHLKLHKFGLVEISNSENEEINGRLARIHAVQDKSVQVWIRHVSDMSLRKHTLKHHQVKVVSVEEEPNLASIQERIQKLRLLPLDSFERDILDLLERVVSHTPIENYYLSSIEARVANLEPGQLEKSIDQIPCSGESLN